RERGKKKARHLRERERWLRRDHCRSTSSPPAFNPPPPNHHTGKYIGFSLRLSPKLAAGSIKSYTSLFGPSLKKSNMTSEAYKNAVLQAKEHIMAGDIFQIVLSQRFERRTFVDPFEIYRVLRIVNPSPFMTYLQVCQFFSETCSLSSFYNYNSLLTMH
ncbi:ASTRA complex subunit, partial [Sarracenia purpurea var. burkii]